MLGYNNEKTFDLFLRRIAYISDSDINDSYYLMPIVRNFFDNKFEGILSKRILEYICIYISYHKKWTDIIGDSLYNYILDDLLFEIKKLSNNRLSIVRKVFNYSNGLIELELSDGNFVTEGYKKEFDNLQIFTNSFIKLIDPIEYRKKQLNSIINGS